MGNDLGAVFVTHPGLQHAHQLAWALHERGLLQAFWSGVPVLGAGEEPPFWMPGSYAGRMKRVAVPAGFRRHPVLFQVLLRAAGGLPAGISRDDYAHRIFHLYDWWVSRQILRLKPRAVIAYENSAYHTFRAAKATGARCILDAPALHHAAAARILRPAPTPYLQEINRRKDQEVALADAILTCSPLAAESYIEAGVPAAKVHSMPLGATLPEGIIPWECHEEPLHFIFAGSLRYLKSIDLILGAFEKVHAAGLPYRLSFVGGQGEPGWVEAIGKIPHATYHEGLPQAALFQKLAQADCLLLPSRFDSFGMVVAEAMACGTPAIVSRQTGAKAIMELCPGAGWIVESTEEDICRCVQERIRNREALFAARDAARQAARSFTWESYRERVGKLIEGLVE